MKKLGRIKALTIASLSAIAIATPIALAQTTSTTQDNKQVTSGERAGKNGRWAKGEGQRKGRREGKGRGGHFGGREHGMMLAGVNLTDDQKAKMKSIRESFRARTQSLHQQLRAKRQELRQAGEGGTFNEALATQKLQENAGLQAKIMAEQFNMRQQMLAVLTPEQKTQLEQKRAEFKAKRAQHAERKMN
ncbi:MAG: motif family protein [Blastocatellia bacterium]|jgi:protein CpxP|nr:motif family protein [Blastocatellia bacterium]